MLAEESGGQRPLTEYLGKLVNMLAFTMTDVLSADQEALTRRRLEAWRNSRSWRQVKGFRCTTRNAMAC